MKIYLTIFITSLLTVFFPMLTLAAATDVTLTTDTVISVAGINLNVSTSDASFESMTVNSDNFSVTMPAGSRLTVSSSDKRILDVPEAGSLQRSSQCTSSANIYTMTNPANAATVTFTVGVNSGTCSAGGGGGDSSGGGGSGGGGGGSGYAPVVAFTPPVPTPQVVPATPTPNVIVGPSLIAQNVSPVFNKNVIPGSKGAEVTRLQQLLATDKSIYPAGIVNGTFGPLTKKAVVTFQIKYGVIKKSNDAGAGNLGPKTRAKIQEVFGSSTKSVEQSLTKPTFSPTSSLIPIPVTPQPQPAPADTVPDFLKLKAVPHQGGASVVNP